mmetsp:Transcript_48891/g.141630  ORF Transcript_48891/g.141630 Transcript_48891/m.141630 type:complete len:511 (+) Transcript_48891:841-2373(+)
MIFARARVQATLALAVESEARWTLPVTSCWAIAWRPWLKPLSQADCATVPACPMPFSQAPRLEPSPFVAALLTISTKSFTSARRTSLTERQPTSAIEVATEPRASRELVKALRASSCTLPAAPYARLTAAHAFLKSSGFDACWAANTDFLSRPLTYRAMAASRLDLETVMFALWTTSWAVPSATCVEPGSPPLNRPLERLWPAMTAFSACSAMSSTVPANQSAVLAFFSAFRALTQALWTGLKPAFFSAPPSSPATCPWSSESSAWTHSRRSFNACWDASCAAFSAAFLVAPSAESAARMCSSACAMEESTVALLRAVASSSAWVFFCTIFAASSSAAFVAALFAVSVKCCKASSASCLASCMLSSITVLVLGSSTVSFSFSCSALVTVAFATSFAAACSPAAFAAFSAWSLAHFMKSPKEEWAVCFAAWLAASAVEVSAFFCWRFTQSKMLKVFAGAETFGAWVELAAGWVDCALATCAISGEAEAFGFNICFMRSPRSTGFLVAAPSA